MCATAVSDIRIPHFIGGEWVNSKSTEWQDLVNPATHAPLGKVPLAGIAEVNAAIEAAAAAFPDWRRTPPEDRIQPLFKLKMLLEEHLDELSRLITIENGKTFTEAKAEFRRAIENVEVACGIPMMMQGYNLEDVARGIDEMMIRQPMGVVAAITPFNFPGMIPFWFLPYAIATGNTFVLKQSERVPLTMQRVYELLQQTGLPKGVVNMVHGGKTAVDTILDHPKVRAISFVGLRPLRNISTRAPRQAASVRSAKAGQRIPWSFFLTPIWPWPRKLSVTAHSVAQGSAVSRSLSRWRLAMRKTLFAIPLPNPLRNFASVSDSTKACRWVQ